MLTSGAVVVASVAWSGDAGAGCRWAGFWVGKTSIFTPSNGADGGVGGKGEMRAGVGRTAEAARGRRTRSRVPMPRFQQHAGAQLGWRGLGRRIEARAANFDSDVICQLRASLGAWREEISRGLWRAGENEDQVAAAPATLNSPTTFPVARLTRRGRLLASRLFYEKSHRYQ